MEEFSHELNIKEGTTLTGYTYESDMDIATLMRIAAETPPAEDGRQDLALMRHPDRFKVFRQSNYSEEILYTRIATVVVNCCTFILSQPCRCCGQSQTSRRLGWVEARALLMNLAADNQAGAEGAPESEKVGIGLALTQPVELEDIVETFRDNTSMLERTTLIVNQHQQDFDSSGLNMGPFFAEPQPNAAHARFSRPPFQCVCDACLKKAVERALSFKDDDTGTLRELIQRTLDTGQAQTYGESEARPAYLVVKQGHREEFAEFESRCATHVERGYIPCGAVALVAARDVDVAGQTIAIQTFYDGALRREEYRQRQPSAGPLDTGEDSKNYKHKI